MPRIVSCYTNCYGEFGIRAAVARIGEAGLDALELALKPHQLGGLVIPESAVLTINSSEAEVEEFARLCEEHGVQITSCNISGGDPKDPEALRVFKRRIDLAMRFGVRVVVCGAGAAESESERQSLYANLRELGDYAGDRAIVIALETHPGLTENADAMLRTMMDLDHTNLRLNFDTGNLLYFNADVDPLEELERVAPLVAHLHLKDSRGKPGEWYFPALGQGGAVDFTGVRETMDGVEFDGPYSIELEGIAGEPTLTLEERQRRVKESVEHLRRCGYFDE